jgi:ribonuclease T2
MNPILFLIFTQFYIPPYCNSTIGNPACINAVDMSIEFSIHGLWPEYNNKSYPSYCNHTAKFDLNKLRPLEMYLNDYWSSYEGSNPSFWKHEYLKHATCFPNVTELQFFNDTLNLYNTIDTNSFFQKHVVPNKMYNRTQLEKTFNGKFHCGHISNFENITTITPSKMIIQIWKCFDLSLKEFTCPDWLEQNSCQDSVYFMKWK